MPVPFWKDENLVQGVPGGSFQAGISNVDDGSLMEQYFTVPWVINQAASWLDYRCWVECELDSGAALHKPLPQTPRDYDTIAAGFVSDANLDSNKSGVKLQSAYAPAGFTDVIQRMATPLYRFVLKGYGLRAGYKVPVPGLKTVAGVPVTPAERQWSRGNVMVGSVGYIPLWWNQWELWYFVALPPQGEEIPPDNLSEHLSSSVQVPEAIQVPYSPADSAAAAGGGPQGFFIGGQRR